MEKFVSLLNTSLASAIIIMIIVIVVERVVVSLIKKSIKKCKQKNVQTMLLFSKKFLSIVIYVIGTLIALSRFSIFSAFSITFLSAIGVIGAILGLALKESLNNFFGTFELLFSQPFAVGDFLKLPEKNISGTVESITMRHTILRNINNEREIIPNSLLNNLIIENSDFSDNEIVLIEEYGVSFNSDIDLAIDIMKEEIVNICNMKFKPKSDIEYPKVRVDKLGDSSVKLRAYIWGNNSAEAWENKFLFNKAIKNRFDENNIEIPYEYINVNLKK